MRGLHPGEGPFPAVVAAGCSSSTTATRLLQQHLQLEWRLPTFVLAVPILVLVHWHCSAMLAGCRPRMLAATLQEQAGRAEGHAEQELNAMQATCPQLLACTWHGWEAMHAVRAVLCRRHTACRVAGLTFCRQPQCAAQQGLALSTMTVSTAQHAKARSACSAPPLVGGHCGCGGVEAGAGLSGLGALVGIHSLLDCVACSGRGWRWAR